MTPRTLDEARRAALLKAINAPRPRREYVPPPVMRCPYCHTMTGNLWMIAGASYFKCSLCKRKL